MKNSATKRERENGVGENKMKGKEATKIFKNK